MSAASAFVRHPYHWLILRHRSGVLAVLAGSKAFLERDRRVLRTKMNFRAIKGDPR
jgi:hypothetical protein